jgi:hypothetical protein
MAVSQMAPYSLYSALLLTRDSLWARVKSSAKQGIIMGIGSIGDAASVLALLHLGKQEVASYMFLM